MKERLFAIFGAGIFIVLGVANLIAGNTDG
jgi:hypothetical protein